MSYPNIEELYKYREFREIYSQKNLYEEKLHMKLYQILPMRYMTNNNEVIKRFLIYHSPGTGKSFTALWILLNFIDTYEKPSIILIKSKEAIMEFKQRIKSWYEYTFNERRPPMGINNYEKFIKKYIEFHTFITFCKSIKNKKDISIYEDRLLIVDEVHNFRDTVGNGNKIIYNKLLKFLNCIQSSRVLFMSATPIFDNYNEITSLVKLIKPNFNFNGKLTPEKLEEAMKGHLSYYGINPPETSVNVIGSRVQGIERFKILKVGMKGPQLQKYQKIIKESKIICNIGINYVKATLGVIDLESDNTTNFKNSNRYIFKNERITHCNNIVQNEIKKQSSDLENYCCKLNQCLDIINNSDAPTGLVFIYCNIIDEVGIYYFASLLCAMGYNYIYDKKSAIKYGQKLVLDKSDIYPGLNEMRLYRNKKKWNFTFITGDKRLCPNVIERLNIFNDVNNKDGNTVRVLFGSDVLSESVDVMNVRQLHILTPHWNYEKINQIIGRIRRVGSHDALPPDQRSVNIYLYMAYDPTMPLTNSVNYSIDYVKYIISEGKYNQALKYNKALENASIESLIFKGHSKEDSSFSTQDTLQYSRNYINRTLPFYISMLCNKLKSIFNSCRYIGIKEFRKELPMLNSCIINEIIDVIKRNNIIINNNILAYSCGMFFLEKAYNVHFYDHSSIDKDIISINSPYDITSYPSNLKKPTLNDIKNNIQTYCSQDNAQNNTPDKVQIQNNISDNNNDNNIPDNIFKVKSEEIVDKVKQLEDNLSNNLIKEFHDSISQLFYTEILEIIKYSLKYDLKNIRKLLRPYWLEYKDSYYISYFSSIKNSAYASNKKRSVNDFSNMIIQSDKEFKNWLPLEDTELEAMSTVFQNHYNEEISKRIKHRLKYVYILCNDFTLRYRDLRNNLNYFSKEKTTQRNLRNINRGRNINNFYNKKELIEVLVYSLCFDNLENELSTIKNYKEISVSEIKNLYENDKGEIFDLIEYILNVVTNNNINEYCCKRPHQAFLMYKLLSSIPHLIDMSRSKIIDKWKNYLFTYNLIVIL